MGQEQFSCIWLPPHAPPFPKHLVWASPLLQQGVDGEGAVVGHATAEGARSCLGACLGKHRVSGQWAQALPQFPCCSPMSSPPPCATVTAKKPTLGCSSLVTAVVGGGRNGYKGTVR